MLHKKGSLSETGGAALPCPPREESHLDILQPCLGTGYPVVALLTPQFGLREAQCKSGSCRRLRRKIWRARSLSGPGNTASLIGGHGKGADWVSWDDLYQWDSATRRTRLHPGHALAGPGGGDGYVVLGEETSLRWASGRVGRDVRVVFPLLQKVSDGLPGG